MLRLRTPTSFAIMELIALASGLEIRYRTDVRQKRVGAPLCRLEDLVSEICPRAYRHASLESAQRSLASSNSRARKPSRRRSDPSAEETAIRRSDRDKSYRELSR